MVTITLPNPNNITNSSNEKVTDNTVIYAATNHKYSYPAHTTPYLFITNYVSEGSYTINKQPVAVNDKAFYLLQPGSNLSIHFKSSTAIETLFILFDNDFIIKNIHQQTTPLASLVDNPHCVGSKQVYIPTVPFMFSQKMPVLLNGIRQGVTLSEVQLEYILADVIAEFCTINADTAKQIQKINTAKTSTREELYRRLTAAKIFMHDNACDAMTIDDVAKAACLNSFHFLRVFKQASGITPHQYIVQLKLEKAYGLLKQQKHSVTDACLQVGFESIGSFSNLFKKRFGVSPSQLLKD